MTKNQFAIINLGLVTVIFVVNSLADVYFWYWEHRWLDIPMHFLGGFFVGNMALYGYYVSGYITPFHRGLFPALFISIATVALVAILWETFEFILDVLTEKPEHLRFQTDVADTMADFVFGMIGGLASVIFYRSAWTGK